MKVNGGFLISQTKQIQERVFERLLSQVGIQEFNSAQGRILYILWQKDYVPIIELSRKTGFAKAILASMLDRMEKLGLVIRILGETSRSQMRISLTDKAKSLQTEYEYISEIMTRILYKSFSDDEITAFENMLSKIVKNLIEAEHEYS